jgi:hypothetical protein
VFSAIHIEDAANTIMIVANRSVLTDNNHSYFEGAFDHNDIVGKMY